MGWPTQGMRETRRPTPNRLTAQLSQFSSSAISLFFSLFFLHPFSPLTSFLSNFACPVPVISPFASPSHPPYIFLTLFFLPQLIRLILFPFILILPSSAGRLQRFYPVRFLPFRSPFIPFLILSHSRSGRKPKLRSRYSRYKFITTTTTIISFFSFSLSPMFFGSYFPYLIPRRAVLPLSFFREAKTEKGVMRNREMLRNHVGNTFEGVKKKTR